MAIVQISRIQHRRGLNQDLPQLSSGELGWSIDTQQLYIGNGTISEGAPVEGRTEILTQSAVIRFAANLEANISLLQSNAASQQSNINSLTATVNGLTLSVASNVAILNSTSGTVAAISANNAVINYTLTQSSKQRAGVITMTRYGTTVAFDDEYNETGTTDVVFGFSTAGNLTYTATATPVTVVYQVKNV